MKKKTPQKWDNAGDAGATGVRAWDMDSGRPSFSPEGADRVVFTCTPHDRYALYVIPSHLCL